MGTMGLSHRLSMWLTFPGIGLGSGLGLGLGLALGPWDAKGRWGIMQH